MSVLFIGLGGVGTHTLRNLNEKMMKYHKDILARTGNAVTEVPKYLFIDTDISIFEENKNNFYPLNSDNYFIQIGQRSPDEIRTANEEVYHINRWCDAPPKNTSMILGADAIRQYSRLALLDNYPGIQGLLTQLMSGFGDSDRIYLITGSAGGTGSGIYMDMLFLIDQIYKANNVLQRGPNTRFIMAMPNGYIPQGNGKQNVQRYKTQLNAFATLQELNDICRDKNTEGGSCFDQSAVVTPTTTRTSFQPFRFGYLYESHNLTPPEVCQQIADFIFEIELAGVEESKNPGQGFDTDLTNKVDSTWNESIENGAPYTKAFCAMGQFSIEKPDWLWREYFEHRLLHELFHQGLRGDNCQQRDSKIFFSLKKEIGANIQRTLDGIKGMISSSEFEKKNPPLKYWNILTEYPDTSDEDVRKVLACKEQLLENVKKSVFGACRQAMMNYSIESVLKALEAIDAEYYESAVKDYSSLPTVINKAKDEHNKYINKSKNFDNYLKNVSRWLEYCVARALSSSPRNNDDIKIQNRGYFDLCQDFLKIAKKGCELEEKKENWETVFKKDVADLKGKKNRCYIPTLDTIVKNGEVVQKSQLVSIYENSIIQTLNGNLLEGTCSIPELHQEVLRQLESDPELGKRTYNEEGYLTAMFDPDPNRIDTLRNYVKSFVTEYVHRAEIIISDVVKRNQNVQNLFKTNIVQRLGQCGEEEQTIIFSKFHAYDDVNLHTQPMATGATLQQVLYISDFHGNTELQEKLGINIALSSSIIDQPEFGDKIVKLIVNCGYNIGNYRYFDDYKQFAEQELKGRISHDPFIDKRFLGEPVNEQYSLCVWDALHKNALIADEADSFDTNLYDLSMANLREVYGMCVVLLDEYLKQLVAQDGKKGVIVPKEVSKGIKSSKGLNYTITTYKYATARKKFVEDANSSINVAAKSLGINDLVDLSWWIDFIQQRKGNITAHDELVAKAIERIEKGFVLSDEMNDILNHIVENNYDYFDAYKVWYKAKTGR